MDAETELADLIAADPNTLPYFITEATTGNAVFVRFEPVVEADAVELQAANWIDAVFRDVGLAYVGDERTLKLTCKDEATGSIQGFVHLGQTFPASGFLRKSLLETAPCNRHDTGVPRYRGIGRVLVARLIMESYRQGAPGRVQIVARPGSEGFYRALGLRASPKTSSVQTFFVTEERAFSLLKSVLYVPEK